MITKGTGWTGVSVLVLGAVLSATPVHFSFDPDTGFQLGAAAFAKDGDDDGGGSSGSGGGGGSDDSGGDDDDDDSGGGSNSGPGGGDDDSGGGDDDDSSGSGSGGDDDDDDDSGRGRGRGGDDDDRDDRGGDDRGGRGDAVTRGTAGTAGGGSGLRVVKVEQGAGGTEIIYSNGVKEEIENGRYEQKNAAGRTVVERAATPADIRRINANIRNSRIALPSPGAGSQVSSVEVAGGTIEVRYATGWKEELEAGRYELKDPNDNTVVERPATSADRRRLQALAGG